jgi:hypothetical protein
MENEEISNEILDLRDVRVFVADAILDGVVACIRMWKNGYQAFRKWKVVSGKYVSVVIIAYESRLCFTRLWGAALG